MGDVRERESRINGRSRILDPIEEVAGSGASISSFVHMGAEEEMRRIDEFKRDEIDIGKRDSETIPRFDDTSHYPHNSKDDLIAQGDLGMASHYNSHLPRSSV